MSTTLVNKLRFDAEATGISVTSGAGAPAAAENNQSLYFQNDSPIWWQRILGVWRTMLPAPGPANYLLESSGLAWQAMVHQRGTATLVAGTVTITATITANSRILVTRQNGLGTLGDLRVPSASRNVGAGTFVVESANILDLSTFDWIVMG